MGPPQMVSHSSFLPHHIVKVMYHLPDIENKDQSMRTQIVLNSAEPLSNMIETNI